MVIQQLPTFQSGQVAFAAFRDSLRQTLISDTACTRLIMLFYAVTELGWSEFRSVISSWKAAKNDRKVIAFVGTDHAITDPQALDQMRSDQVDVRLLIRYRGIFHPKVVWLSGPGSHFVWVGSNNLTREGLRSNIECATIVQSTEPHPDFVRWVEAIELAASPLTSDLLESYQNERNRYGAARVNLGTFTWSKKEEPSSPTPIPSAPQPSTTDSPSLPTGVHQGDLLVQVMPRETAQAGNQVQLPKAAGVQFFRLPDRVGATRQIRLTYEGGLNPRNLTMTIFRNNTIRLSLNELDYRDRPCVLVFRRMAPNQFEYEIVQQSIFPSRYRRILQMCVNQTRAGSRRWGICQ